MLCCYVSAFLLSFPTAGYKCVIPVSYRSLQNNYSLRRYEARGVASTDTPPISPSPLPARERRGIANRQRRGRLSPTWRPIPSRGSDQKLCTIQGIVYRVPFQKKKAFYLTVFNNSVSLWCCCREQPITYMLSWPPLAHVSHSSQSGTTQSKHPVATGTANRAKSMTCQGEGESSEY